MRSCSVFTFPPGAHTCLKCAYVFTHPVGYSGSLSTANETCNKDKRYCTKKYCRCTSYKSSRTFKSGVHLFASLEKTTCRHRPILRSLMSKRPLQVSPFLHGCCSVDELRGTFWLSNLVFCGLSDALGQSDNENLFTILISISPHHVFEIMGIERVSYKIQHIVTTRWIYPHKSLRAHHEFSTSVRWLSYVDIA